MENHSEQRKAARAMQRDYENSEWNPSYVDQYGEQNSEQNEIEERLTAWVHEDRNPIQQEEKLKPSSHYDPGISMFLQELQKTKTTNFFSVAIMLNF